MYVPAEVVEQIVQIGHAYAPREAVGLLFDWGSRREPEIVPLINRAPRDKLDMYELDWDDLQGELEARGEVCLDVVLWHTHPSGLVGPSRGDMTHRIKGVKYMVVTLPGGEAVQF